MTTRWVYRQAHRRMSKLGRVAEVRATWALCMRAEPRSRRRSGRKCPVCGARILSVRMPNRGWVHFEGAAGLGRVKHPCLHMGEGISKARDSLTLDLFEERKGILGGAVE